MLSLIWSRSRLAVHLILCGGLFAGLPSLSTAAEGSVAPALDQHTLDKRTQPVLKALKLDASDAAKMARVKAVLDQHLLAVQAWHQQHADALDALWNQWNDARVPAHKDEVKVAQIGEQIDALYASFRPAHDAFLSALQKELSAAEIETVKNAMTARPGLERTYDAYLEMVPALTPADRQEIHHLLEIAREEALDAPDDRKGAEKVRLFKKQKVKVQDYLDAHGYDYEKSYKAWVDRLKAKSGAAKKHSS
jgi:hypothetical protein